MAIDHVCGYECRINVTGAVPAPDERHWDTANGTPTISTTTVRTGTAALRSNPTAATAYMGKTVARTVVAGRVYVRFAAFVGAGDGQVAFIANANANGNLSVTIDSSGQVRVKAGAGTAVTVNSPLSTGIWYRIDWLADSSGGTASMKARIDGGTESEATNVQASVNITSVRTGIHSAATADVFYDDLIVGTVSGDYPFGDGTVERMKPTRDGTHSFTAGDFGYDTAGADILTSATDVWTKVDDDDLTSTADLIRQKVIRSTGYVEVGFGSAPFSHDALAVNCVSSWHASATGANTIGLRMIDGGSTKVLTDDAGDDLSDFSNTTITFHHLVQTTAPSGGAWTAAKIGALLLRMGFSTDVIGIPYWDGVMLEIAYAPAPATQQPRRNPFIQLLSN